MSKSIVVVLFFTAGLISGCANNYYGYTKQEWHALSEQEQQRAITEYQDIVDLKQDQQHRDKIEARKQQIIDFGSGLEHKF